MANVTDENHPPKKGCTSFKNLDGESYLTNLDAEISSIVQKENVSEIAQDNKDKDNSDAYLNIFRDYGLLSDPDENLQYSEVEENNVENGNNCTNGSNSMGMLKKSDDYQCNEFGKLFFQSIFIS